MSPYGCSWLSVAVISPLILSHFKDLATTGHGHEPVKVKLILKGNAMLALSMNSSKLQQ